MLKIAMSLLAGAVVFGTTVNLVVAQSQKTENTLSLDPGQPVASVDLTELNWLVGRWVGKGLGGECEEVFLPVWNDTMIGTFRYAKEGNLVFSEFFSFTKSDEGVVLRLKHFHPDLVSWEEKEDSVMFPLIKLERNAAYFGGLTYRLINDNELMVWVAMRNRNTSELGEAVFEFRRAKMERNDDNENSTAKIGTPQANSEEAVQQSDSSHSIEIVQTERDHALRKEVIVQASLAKTWQMWTSSEGVSEFFSPDSNIELQIGGAYEMFFGLPADEHGKRGSEGSRIISFIPYDFLLFEWTFPPAIPALRESGATTQVMLRFERLDENHVRVQLSQFGWQAGDDWERGYEYFDKAWQFVLDSFQQAVEQ